MPGIAIRLAGTAAVSTVAPTNVVDSVVLFQCTTEPDVKPAPVTVSVNAGPPASAVLGLMVLIVGAATIVKTSAFEPTLSETTVT